jgi:basic membrane protein A
MSTLQKRQFFKLAAVSALSALTLAACGDKPAEQAAAPQPAAAPEAPAAATPQPQQPLKVAFAYIGPVGDGGWSFAHDQARKQLQAEFGDRIQTTYVESVPEGADAERVLRDLASQGNTLIFGTTFGYMDTIQKLAADFPDVKWEHATGYKTAANVRTYDSRTYEGAYLAGIVAGSMTRSNRLGVVGSVPIPEVLRNLNSFTLGAQSVNPNITTKVVWVNEWFSPPKETEAATSLINSGVDVLFQNTDSPAVLKTAQEKGVRAFGWDSDMQAYGPEAHLGSAAINWVPYYTKAVNDVLNGTWSEGKSWWGVKEGAIDLVSMPADIPQEVQDKVAAAKAGLKDGSLAIWKGPIADNQGQVVLPEGQVADDEFLSRINFFVQGVEGKVPGSK